MRELQEKIVAEMGVRPNMTEAQARDEITRRAQFLCDYAKATGTHGFVLGISGGIDSTLAGRLCQLASEKLNAEGYQAQFMAVRLPYKTQVDEEDAQKALEFIAPRPYRHLQYCGCGRWLRHRLHGCRGQAHQRLQQGKYQGASPHDRPVCARWRPFPAGRRNRPRGGIRDRFLHEVRRRRGGYTAALRTEQTAESATSEGSGRIRTAVG